MNCPDTLLLAWHNWQKEYKGLMPYHSQRFGQHFINNYLKRGYKNPEIFYETNDEKAFTEIMWLAASEELDKWLLDEYTTQTNQTGGA